MSVDDRLFETLDPTTRGFEHEGKRYLVTDTVGFIRRLPTQLVEGFASTLEETLVADLVLHVADASLADERLEETIAAVETVLAEIGADELPVELVLNKIDAARPARPPPAREPLPGALQISAADRRGARGAPRAGSPSASRDRFEDVRLLLPYEEGGASPSSTRSARRSRSARTRRRASSSGRGCRGARSAASRRYLVAESTAATLDREPKRRDRAADRARLRERRRPAERRPTRATPASTSRPASASTLGPGERAIVGTGLAVAIPDGYAGFVAAALRARRDGTGSTIVNSPGLIDSGYRGEVRVVLLNTDREGAVHRRAGHADRAARGRAVPERASCVEVDELPASERGERGFGSSRP